MKQFWNKIPWFQKSQEVKKVPDPVVIDHYVNCTGPWHYDLVNETIKLSKEMSVSKSIEKAYTDSIVYGGYYLNPVDWLGEIQVKSPGINAMVQLEAPKEPEEYVDLGWGFDDRE